MLPAKMNLLRALSVNDESIPGECQSDKQRERWNCGNQREEHRYGSRRSRLVEVPLADQQCDAANGRENKIRECHVENEHVHGGELGEVFVSVNLNLQHILEWLKNTLIVYFNCTDSAATL